MFCLKGKGSRDAKLQETSNTDDFGWWVGNEDDLKSPMSSQSKDTQSLCSSESMLSCIDSDDNENYSLAQEYGHDPNDKGERIELKTVTHEDLNVDLIERDAIRNETDVTPCPAKEAKEYFDELDLKSDRSQGICYTPERLVRSQEYRILAPSPRYFSISQARIMPENENPGRAVRSRRRLNYLIDSKQIGASQLKVLLDSNRIEIATPAVTSCHWESCERAYSNDATRKIESHAKTETALDTEDHKKSTPLQSSDFVSERSSYERLNVTWEDCKKMGTRSSSLEDTSGIQSNDWSSDTHSDLQNTPPCDELPSTNYKLDVSQERCRAINEVMSILDVLDTDPEKAAILLEEDRFCDSTSSHDQLTRLALAIETDVNVPGLLENSDHSVHHLQRKVEDLQIGNKDIDRDMCDLRKSFQYDERRITNLSSSANKLRQEIHEMRYLDDLLDLLRGELETISKRNWPFVIGHTGHPEDMNLIV